MSTYEFVRARKDVRQRLKSKSLTGRENFGKEESSSPFCGEGDQVTLTTSTLLSIEMGWDGME